MVFIEIREGYEDPAGIERMAKRFSTLMLSGGLNVGMAGVEER